MAITYRQSKFDLPYQVPVLHKVVYGVTQTEIPDILEHRRRSQLIADWLRENCRHKYYSSPGYTHEKFIEFECDEDAMMFALKWQ